MILIVVASAAAVMSSIMTALLTLKHRSLVCFVLVSLIDVLDWCIDVGYKWIDVLVAIHDQYQSQPSLLHTQAQQAQHLLLPVADSMAEAADAKTNAEAHGGDEYVDDEYVVDENDSNDDDEGPAVSENNLLQASTNTTRFTPLTMTESSSSLHYDASSRMSGDYTFHDVAHQSRADEGDKDDDDDDHDQDEVIRQQQQQIDDGDDDDDDDVDNDGDDNDALFEDCTAAIAATESLFILSQSSSSSTTTNHYRNNNNNNCNHYQKENTTRSYYSNDSPRVEPSQLDAVAVLTTMRASSPLPATTTGRQLEDSSNNVDRDKKKVTARIVDTGHDETFSNTTIMRSTLMVASNPRNALVNDADTTRANESFMPMGERYENAMLANVNTVHGIPQSRYSNSLPSIDVNDGDSANTTSNVASASTDDNSMPEQEEERRHYDTGATNANSEDHTPSSDATDNNSPAFDPYFWLDSQYALSTCERVKLRRASLKPATNICDVSTDSEPSTHSASQVVSHPTKQPPTASHTERKRTATPKQSSSPGKRPRVDASMSSTIKHPHNTPNPVAVVDRKPPSSRDHPTSRNKSSSSTYEEDMQNLWDVRFRQLVDFKLHHGHCLVPYRFPPNLKLGHWVSNQRLFYRRTPRTISKERVQRLDSIGFAWHVREARWDKAFEELVNYQRQHGDCFVPDPFPDNPTLGKWVTAQRQFYKSHPKKISAECIQRLDDLGFDWDA